jgi:hypothetical protein
MSAVHVCGSRFRGHVERDYRALCDALNARLARPITRSGAA